MKKSTGGFDHSTSPRYDRKRSHGRDYLSHIRQECVKLRFLEKVPLNKLKENSSTAKRTRKACLHIAVFGRSFKSLSEKVMNIYNGYLGILYSISFEIRN